MLSGERDVCDDESTTSVKTQVVSKDKAFNSNRDETSYGSNSWKQEDLLQGLMIYCLIY